MPATSGKQARYARMCEHSDHPPSSCPKRGALRHFQRVGKKGRKTTMLKGER